MTLKSSYELLEKKGVKGVFVFLYLLYPDFVLGGNTFQKRNVEMDRVFVFGNLVE